MKYALRIPKTLSALADGHTVSNYLLLFDEMNFLESVNQRIIEEDC